MDAAAASWYSRRTSHWTDWEAAALVDAKGASRVSVVIPARNEAPTIGGIVAGIRHELMDRHPLVDELVVIDSDSTDGTAVIAADNGATVHAARSIRPDLGGYAGKGEAMWKSLFVTTGQTIAFIDADLTGWGTHFVAGLLGPMLADPAVRLVKGFYDRVLEDGSTRHAPQGGRVTELVARRKQVGICVRPVRFAPDLHHVVGRNQPPAHDYGGPGRRCQRSLMVTQRPLYGLPLARFGDGNLRYLHYGDCQRTDYPIDARCRT